MKPLLLLLFTLFLGACTLPPLAPLARVESKPSTLVVVHGLFANANHVAPLTEGLRAQGFTCFAPNLQPNNGSTAIESLAEQLDGYIQQNIPSDAPIQLIGHSMGGLVALQYLQDPQRAARCRGLFTIATPHRGTLLASLHGGVAGRQMVSNSSFLRNLHAQPPSLPVTTYRSTNDLVIIPNSSSTLPFADNELIESPGHNEILRSEALLKNLLARIRDLDL